MTQPTPPLPGDDPDETTPEYAAMLGLVAAGPGYRSLAFAIDAAIWLALASPAVIGGFMLAGGADTVLSIVLLSVGAAAALLFGLIQLLLHGRRGVTAGKAALRLRSVSVADYGRPGFWRIVLRALVLGASGIVLVAGPALMFASGLWDPQRRGRSILDRVGRCWLVDCRAGIDPFDAKAMRHARRALRGRPDDIEELPSMATGADPERALRIPGARSRAGVVGPGSTGAQWRAEPGEAPVIAQVPVMADVAGTDGGGRGPEGSVLPTATLAPTVAVEPAAAAQPAVKAAPPRVEVDPPAATQGSAPAPTVTAAVSEQAPRRRAQAMLRFDDGSIVRVPGVALIGRDPAPSEGEAVDALVRLDDPERLMSKTHAAFGQDAEGVWLADRGSRNGTQLRGPGGETVEVPAGERTRIPLGWTAHVGGRSFELVARGADS